MSCVSADSICKKQKKDRLNPGGQTKYRRVKTTTTTTTTTTMMTTTTTTTAGESGNNKKSTGQPRAVDDGDLRSQVTDCLRGRITAAHPTKRLSKLIEHHNHNQNGARRRISKCRPDTSQNSCGLYWDILAIEDEHCAINCIARHLFQVSCLRGNLLSSEVSRPDKLACRKNESSRQTDCSSNRADSSMPADAFSSSTGDLPLSSLVVASEINCLRSRRKNLEHRMSTLRRNKEDLIYQLESLTSMLRDRDDMIDHEHTLSLFNSDDYIATTIASMLCNRTCSVSDATVRINRISAIPCMNTIKVDLNDATESLTAALVSLIKELKPASDCDAILVIENPKNPRKLSSEINSHITNPTQLSRIAKSRERQRLITPMQDTHSSHAMEEESSITYAPMEEAQCTMYDESPILTI